jgi:hypothetical protein
MPLPGHTHTKTPSPFNKDFAPPEHILIATLPKCPWHHTKQRFWSSGAFKKLVKAQYQSGKGISDFHK